MGKSCVLYPTIKVGNQEVESRLFKDLLSLTGDRESAKYIYGLTKVPEINTIFKGAELDENGEYTIESVNRILNIKDSEKGSSLFLEKKEIGATDNDGNIIVYSNPNDIISKVINYNTNNPNLAANIVKSSEGYVITLEHKDIENSTVPSNLVFNNDLNNRLLSMVRRLGFDIEVEDTALYDGVFDPTNATTTAEGLKTIIKIAKGQLGEDAFPEEFSHMMIAGLRKEALVQRLLNLIDTNVMQEVLGESYDKYYKRYEGNTTRLKEEVAGKLLKEHIINPNKQENILQRIWNWIKNKFKSLSINDIDNAISEANKGFAELASRIMDESIFDSIEKTEILNTRPLYKLADETNKLKELAEKALETASKKLEIIRTRTKNGKYSDEDILSIKKLQESIEKKKYAKSCILFLQDSLSQIEDLYEDLNKLNRKTKISSLEKIRRTSFILRTIKEFSDGYSPIIAQLTAVKSMQENGEISLSEKDASEISALALNISGTLNIVENNYKKLRFQVVLDFLKLYLGDDKLKGIGKNAEDAVTIESILEMANKDISGVDRWVVSLSDASDPLLSVIDKVVKITKTKRDATIADIAADLRAAHVKLVNSGNNTNFMFERDNKGNLTGRIISDYDFIRFNEEREAYKKSLEKQNLPAYTTKSKLEAWERRHTEPVIVDEYSDRVERLPIYKKNVLSGLNNDQREYYNTMIKAKSILESMLPNRSHSNLYNAVQIRSDVLTAAVSGKMSVAEASNAVLSSMKDNFIRRGDDTDFGDSSINVMLDFSGKPVERIPVYYTRPLEDMSRLSQDFTGAMIAYTSMAVNYSEMNKVIDALELTRSLVKEREVQQFSGNNKMTEAFKVLHKEFNSAYTKKGETTKIGARLDDYYESVIYNKAKKDEGTIGNTDIDTAKTIDSIKSYTGVMGLGLNLFSALSNVTLGNIQSFIEGVGGEFFTLKDAIIGGKNYWKLLPEYLGEIGSAKKTSKLALLMDKFDALEEFNNSQKAQGNFKGPLAKILGNTSIYILNNLGEHYLHCRTMFAMLNATKVKLNGKEITLLDAFKIDEIKDGTRVLGAKLKLKEGVTDKDGNPITEEYLQDLKLKIGKVNQAMNGAFNDDDKGAIHRHSLGRLAMQFRQWMPAHYSRRFASKYYDAILETEREGYYRTSGRFLFSLMKDLMRAKFEIGTHWESLKDYEKANIKKALGEIGIYVLIHITLSLMGPEKDREGQWAARVLIYNLKRAKLEIGASAPISTDILDNAWTILQSPAAAIKTVNNITDLLEFQNMNVELQSGRYKGWSKYERDLIEVIPIYNKIMNIKGIADDDYMFKIFD